MQREGQSVQLMAWVIAGATGEQPGARFLATWHRQVAACSLCCTAVACNGGALRQGVVTGSTADSDDASSTTERFVNALADGTVILRSDASKTAPVKAR